MKRISALLFTAIVPLLLASACQSAAPTSLPTETPTSTPLVVTATPGAGQVAGAAPTEEQIVITPTPQPTATPGPIDRLVADISNTTGLNRQVILGLTGEEWINLGISLLFVILGIVLLTRLVYTLLRFATRYIPGERDDQFIRAIKNQVYLIISVWIIEFATGRLGFLSVEAKETLNQLYFALYILAITVILWKLIDMVFEWQLDARNHESEIDDQHRTSILMLKRLLRGLLILAALTVVLNNNGVNVTVVLAAFIIGALAVSLAAQDMLSDMIYGFIILFDRPYRVGDRVEVPEMGTWGDVVGIGTRSTHVRTRDNRMVIMPNSSIGKNQITNYTYPDPSMRIQTDLDIAYGSDFEQVERVIAHTVLGFDEVLSDMPVNVLLIKFGDSALKYRVRWWVDSYLDTYIILDMVHKAIYAALDEAGIVMPNPTYDVNLNMGPNQNEAKDKYPPGLDDTRSSNGE